MKKINLIMALSVITMGAIVPTSILMSNNQNVVENKEIISTSVNDDQLMNNSQLINNSDIDDSNTINNIDESKIVGEIINANDPNCFAEGDTTKNANEWMGITGVEFVKFTITKDWISASDVGTVSVSGVSASTIASSKLTIPSYIINNGNRYDVTTIGSGAFRNCAGLTGNLTIPSNMTSIGNQAFVLCVGLTDLDLTKATNLTTIKFLAFGDCDGLTGNLIIPNSVTNIEIEAFKNTYFSNVYFSTMAPPATLGTNIFGYGNYTTTINVPKGAKTAWDATPNILGKLGIASLDQIVEFAPPASILPITLDKEGPYVLDNISTASSNVVKASSAILPAEASQDINWTIMTKNEATKPNNINIDTNGQVTIDPTNTMQPIKYDLTITATCPTDATITTSKDVAIYIAAIDTVTFENTLPKVKNNIIDKTKINKANVTIKPADASLTIEWSIKQSDDTNAPGWISIDQATGEIFVNNVNTVELKEYTFKVIATCSTNVNIYKSANLIVEVINSDLPDPQPTTDFPWWAILAIVAGVTLLVTALTVTIVTINRKNKKE